MRCLRERNLETKPRDQNQPFSMLGHTEVSEFQDIIGNFIAGSLKPIEEFFEKRFAACKQTGDVFHHANRRLEFRNQPQELQHKCIAGIASPILLRQPREALAWWAADDEVDLVTPRFLANKFGA